MDENEYKGIEAVSTTTCKLENGRWKVVMRLVQQRSKDLEAWEAKEVFCDAIDEDLQKAVGQTYAMMTAFLEGVKGDLFGKVDTDAGQLPS